MNPDRQKEADRAWEAVSLWKSASFFVIFTVL